MLIFLYLLPSFAPLRGQDALQGQVPIDSQNFAQMKVMKSIDVFRNRRFRIIEFNSDLSTAAIVFDDDIHIWNIATRQQMFTLEGHTDYIDKLIFVDESLLLSGGEDSTLRLWNTQTGKELWHITTDAGITALAFDPIQQIIAAGHFADENSDVYITLWDYRTREPIDVIFNNEGWFITDLAFGPESILISANFIGVLAWDLETLKHEYIAYEAANLARFDNSGEYLGIKQDNGEVVLKHWQYGSELWIDQPEPLYSNVLVFSPDGSLLVSYDDETGLFAWDIAVSRRKLLPPSLLRENYPLAFSSDGWRLATIKKGTIEIIEVPL